MEDVEITDNVAFGDQMGGGAGGGARIVKGNVKLNYNVCEKKNATVGQGDMISCRGRGRVEVKEILEQQNDRYRIELVRYK